MSEKEPLRTEESQEAPQIISDPGQDNLVHQQLEANTIVQEDNNTQKIEALKNEIEQIYDSGKVWNILSRHNLEWAKSISPEDLKTIKEYHRWSLPVNHFLRGIDLPERVTPEDRANINPIIETLDKAIKNCPPTPIEFKAYRAVSENITLEDAQKMVGKNIAPDKGYMSTATSKKLAVNDFLQKREDKFYMK